MCVSSGSSLYLSTNSPPENSFPMHKLNVKSLSVIKKAGKFYHLSGSHDSYHHPKCSVSEASYNVTTYHVGNNVSQVNLWVKKIR